MSVPIPENQQQYGSILTVLGENAEQNGKILNKQITFTEIAVGDANDTYVQPNRNQQTLVNELARISVNSVDIMQASPDAVPLLKVEAILPDNIHELVGDKDVILREFAAVATFNGNTYFHAVGNCARIYVPKPVSNGNVSNPVIIEMIFAITSAEPIVEIDPNVVQASREYVDKQKQRTLVETKVNNSSQMGLVFIADWEPKIRIPTNAMSDKKAWWSNEENKFITPINDLPFLCSDDWDSESQLNRWQQHDILTLNVFDNFTALLVNPSADMIKAALTKYEAVCISNNFTLSSTVDIPATKSVFSMGANTQCNISGNHTGFTLNNDSTLSGIRFIGAGKNSDMPLQNAIYVNPNQSGSSVSNVKFTGISGSCYSGGHVVGHHAGNSITNYSIDSCNIGLDIKERFEFVHTSQGSITRCNIGANIIGGNFCGGGGVVVCDNKLGIKIGIGDNDSHGHCTGWTVNHNTKTLEYTAPLNGFEFLGCEFWNGGAIHLIDCANVKFQGGIISGVPIYEDGCYSCYMINVDFGSNGIVNHANYNSKPSQVFYVDCIREYTAYDSFRNTESSYCGLANNSGAGLPVANEFMEIPFGIFEKKINSIRNNPYYTFNNFIDDKSRFVTNQITNACSFKPTFTLNPRFYITKTSTSGFQTFDEAIASNFRLLFAQIDNAGNPVLSDSSEINVSVVYIKNIGYVLSVCGDVLVNRAGKMNFVYTSDVDLFIPRHQFQSGFHSVILANNI